MLKIKFTPLLILLIPHIFFAQSSLSGSITNREKDPVPFANVILLSAADSTSVYKGTTSEDDGSFIIDNIQDSTYLLKVSFVGYAESLQKITLEGDTRIAPIILEEASDALDEVVVNARKPKIIRQADRLVFEVENTILSTGNTYDILKRTPGVILSQGQLLIKNQPATVYINDRKVYLSAQELQQLLEGFSGVNVKSIEVITNPPSRYDAEGGAILNIRTSKNLSIGYKGSLNASNTLAVVPKFNVGTNQYYKTDWLSFFGSYNLNLRNDYKRDENFVSYFEADGEVDSRWFTDFDRNTESTSHAITSVLDFSLSENSSLNLSANLQFTPREESDINGLTSIYNGQDSLDSLYTTKSDLNSETKNILLNASYLTSLGEAGTLSIIGNFINYNNDQVQNLKTRYFSPDESLLNSSSFYTLGNQKSNIYTGQLDISLPWGSSSVETGLKYSGFENESGQLFYEADATQELNPAFSDNLDYDEQIYAAYLSFSREWGKLSLQAGLRGEYSSVDGVSESLGSVNSQDYFRLFPTAYLMYTASENHSYAFNYSRRIGRPGFQSLNTFRYFLTEDNFKEGNPNLRPQYTDKLSFNYVYKNKLSFDLYWERTDDALGLMPYQDNMQRNFRTVSLNKEYEQQYSLDIEYYDFVTDWWYFYGYFSFYQLEERFKALESEAEFAENDLLGIYFSSQNAFYLDKNGTFSSLVTFSYLPGFIAGSYDFDEAQFGLNIGFRKTFFDGRLVTTIDSEDIFNSMNIPLSSKYLNQNNSYYARPESQKIRFGLVYKFGNFKLDIASDAGTIEEKNRLDELRIDQ